MAFFKKKEKELDEDLLDELERETKFDSDLGGGDLPPPPPAPSATTALPPPPPRRPKMAAPMPMPPSPHAPPRAPAPHAPQVTMPAPALSDDQIAKLPLFMKVEEYDDIVHNLKDLVDALKEMGEILGRMNELEQKTTQETTLWRKQLNKTNDMVSSLLGKMPESGKIKDLLDKKETHENAEKLQEEVERLKKDITEKTHKEHSEKISKEVGDLKEGINSLKNEMGNLHGELKSLSNLTRMKTAEALKEKPKTKPVPMPMPSLTDKYKRTKEKPW